MHLNKLELGADENYTPGVAETAKGVEIIVDGEAGSPEGVGNEVEEAGLSDAKGHPAGVEHKVEALPALAFSVEFGDGEEGGGCEVFFEDAEEHDGEGGEELMHS